MSKTDIVTYVELTALHDEYLRQIRELVTQDVATVLEGQMNFPDELKVIDYLCC